jgi:hypothetical protein
MHIATVVQLGRGCTSGPISDQTIPKSCSKWYYQIAEQALLEGDDPGRPKPQRISIPNDQTKRMYVGKKKT